MQASKKISSVRGLENAILFSIALFIFKLVFATSDGLILLLINELLVFLAIASLYKYIHVSLSKKVDVPLSLSLNVGILGALLFFIFSITNTLYKADKEGRIDLNFFNSLLSILLIFLFIAGIVFIFSTFRELSYLRQKKDPSLYFNSMLWFFSFSFFTGFLTDYKDLIYINDTFFTVTIVLIVLNSLRVAWIAFLTKKQKYYLLGLSIVLSIVFGLASRLVLDTIIVRQLIYTFSPGLHTVCSLVLVYGSIYFGVIFFTTLFHLPTAEAFDRKAQEVTSLMDLTKLITQVFDFKEMADTVTDLTIKVCNSDSAWLATKTSEGIELNSVHKIGFVDANRVTKKLIGDGENGFNVVQTIDYDSYFPEIKRSEEHFKSIVVAPLKVHGNINGYLFTARNKENAFDTDAIKAVEAFADYAAVALENAKLFKESIEKERMEKELDVARDVQRRILPREIPSSKELEVSSLFVPAFEVGGDYYDFFKLDEDKLAFVVADVSGKGISASFIMAEVKGIFESLSRIIQSPRDLLIAVNDILKGNLERKSFVTAIYGIINRKTGVVNLVRAGHTPVIVCSQGKASRFQPSGIGLGLDFSSNFANSLKELEIQLKNNDIFVCYSDGITEAKNIDEQDFGYDVMEKIICDNDGDSLDNISKKIMEELSLFSQDHSQHDDITLVLFKWKSIN